MSTDGTHSNYMHLHQMDLVLHWVRGHQAGNRS